MESIKKNKKVVIILIVILVVIGIATLLYFLLHKNNIGVNTPKLIEGMTPVKWNGTEWVKTTSDDKEWYNYSNKEWANTITKDGSMWVWIPRYAYKITKGYHGEDLEYKAQSSLTTSTKEGGNIEVVFLKDTTNTTYNGKNIDTNNSSSNMNYVIHPSFTFGGEELTGFWVAKYEASRTNSTNTDEGTSTTISFLNNKLSITDYDLNNITYQARNMENQGIYGWKEQTGTILKDGYITDDNNNFDTHLMKNIEWGAVTYLAQSKFGINKEIAGNTSLISGKGGVNSTTTGNETGIYDMAGQNTEYVSAYYKTDSNNQDIKTYTNITNFNEKYVDIYNSYGTDNFGDAIYETSLENSARRSWYEGQSDLNTSYPFFQRGKSSYSNSIYSFLTSTGDKSNAISEYKLSFRVSIVTSNDVLNEAENQDSKSEVQQQEIQNIKNNNLSMLLNSLDTNYAKGYINAMNTFSYTYNKSDVDFEKIRNYYNTFINDYKTFKDSISKYQTLENELQELIPATDKFIIEFEKATTSTQDVELISNCYVNSSNEWDICYKLIYKALYGKDVE